MFDENENLNDEDLDDDELDADEMDEMNMDEENEMKDSASTEEDYDVVRPNPDDILISWQANEYLHHERSVLWYLIGFTVILLLVLYGIFSSAWTMVIAVALMGAVVYLYSHEIPKVQDIVITKLGVHFGNKYYSYHQLSSFWIINEANYKAVVLDRATQFGEQIVILLPAQNVSEIRDVLLASLPENEGKEEHIWDKLGRILKI